MKADLEKQIHTHARLINEKREMNYPKFRKLIMQYDNCNKEKKDPFLQCLTEASEPKYFAEYIFLGMFFSIASSFAGALAALLVMPKNMVQKDVILLSGFVTSFLFNDYVRCKYQNLEDSRLEYELGKCIESYEDFIYG
jgi:hypothetical protein